VGEGGKKRRWWERGKRREYEEGGRRKNMREEREKERDKGTYRRSSVWHELSERVQPEVHLIRGESTKVISS
jgi:hypothetical protein